MTAQEKGNGVKLKRAMLIAIPAAAVAVMAVGPGTAYAATTHEFVYHANGLVAGEVWYNAGDSNLSKGWNSFTIKDDFCGDGWKIELFVYINGALAWSDGLPQDCPAGATSAEKSFSLSNDVSVPAQAIYWQACKKSTTDSLLECGAFVGDVMR